MGKQAVPAARKLLEKARKLQDEDLRFSQFKEVIRRADLEQDIEVGVEARLELLDELDAHPAEVLALLTWCLAQCDRDPERFPEKDLLWRYKRIVLGIENLPQIPMHQIQGLIEDIGRRYSRNGLSLRPIFRIKLFLAMATGRREEAESAHWNWVSAPRDEFADCSACERDTEVQYRVFREQDKRALRMAGPILDGRLECKNVPRQTLSELLLPLVRLGQLVGATWCHRQGYRLIENRKSYVGDAAKHLVFLALTGKLAKARKVFQHYIPFPLNAEVADHAHRFEFTLASRFFIERLRAKGQRTAKFDLPKEFPPYQESGTYDLVALEEWFEADARRLAALFDARNGTNRFTHLIENNHALKDLVVNSDPARSRSSVTNHEQLRSSDDEDDSSAEEPSDDKEELEEEEEDGAICPACETNIREQGPCPHLVSTWSFGEGDGQWAGDNYERLQELQSAVDDFAEVAGSLDKRPAKLIKTLLPKRLHDLVKCYDCDDYLESLITASPTYLGSSDDETSGSGTSSSWKNYWDDDAAACAGAVEEQLAEDVELLREATKKLEAYWDETAGEDS
jgi:hypothetical protein